MKRVIQNLKRSKWKKLWFFEAPKFDAQTLEGGSGGLRRVGVQPLEWEVVFQRFPYIFYPQIKHVVWNWVVEISGCLDFIVSYFATGVTRKCLQGDNCEGAANLCFPVSTQPARPISAHLKFTSNQKNTFSAFLLVEPPTYHINQFFK